MAGGSRRGWGSVLGERDFKTILGRFSVGLGRSRDGDTVPEKADYLGEEKEMITKAGVLLMQKGWPKQSPRSGWV